MARTDKDRFEPEKPGDKYLGKPVTSSAGAQVVDGLGINFVSQSLKILLALTSTIVLTRLLTPSDFGMIAMVVLVVGFVTTFRDAGLGLATVQRQDLTHTQVSSVFWITIGLSVLAAAILAGASPLIAIFFDEPQLIPITLALSLGVAIGGAGIQHNALLQRNLEFRSLALIQLIALASGLAVAITMAANGYGYWALVANTVVTASIDTALSWILCKWRPSRPHLDPEIGSMLRFGGALSGFNFINYFSRNGDNLLIGWRWGADSLGLYSRAYELIMLPIRHINAPLASVAVPVLSRLQNERVAFQRMYCQLTNLVAWLTIPLVSYLCINANQLVLLLWGEAWLLAAPLLQMLALATIGQSIVNSTGWIYIAQDRTEVMLKVGIGVAIVMISAFWFALPYGAMGVATAYAIVMNLLFAPLIYIACRSTGVEFSEVMKSTRVPIVLSATSALLGYWAGLTVDQSATITALMVSAAIFVGVFGSAFVIWPSCRSEVVRVLDEVKNRFTPS